MNLFCRSGTSPPRSVHQWTARAWVPACLVMVVGLSSVGLDTVYTLLALNERLDFGAKQGAKTLALQAIGGSGETAGQDRVRDTTAFLCADHDGLRAVGDP